MAMQPAEIEALIKAALPDAVVTIDQARNAVTYGGQSTAAVHTHQR